MVYYDSIQILHIAYFNFLDTNSNFESRYKYIIFENEIDLYRVSQKTDGFLSINCKFCMRSTGTMFCLHIYEVPKFIFRILKYHK